MAVAPTAATPPGPLLEVEDLRTWFPSRQGTVRAVDGVSYALGHGETLGVVGESGCGKSVTALSILRLIQPPGRIVGGSIRFGGVDLLTLSDREMRRLRGNEISMIFQEPMSSLNPVLSVGRQIVETILLHQPLSRAAATERAQDMLRLVGLPDPRRHLDEYPHQLSGGMRQRVMIAMALACSPKVLVADEPTTALDVTVQAQIVELMQELQSKLGTAIIIISHDLGLIAETAERVVVMYAGRKVEEAPVRELFLAPRHPYTRGLLSSIPKLAPPGISARPGARRPRLQEISGMIPPLHGLPVGCAFAPRCAFAVDQCRRESPPLVAHGPGRQAACWRSDELPGWQL